MKRNTTLWLVGLNLLLACLLAWLWIDPDGGGLRGMHWKPPAPIRPDLGSLAAGAIAREDADVSRFMAILDRPVFSPGRRPPPPKIAGSAADPLDGIHLYGLFTGSEGGGVIVRVEGKTRRIKLSEALGDWRLKEIRDRDVVFARGAENRVVPLVSAKQTAAPAPGQPTAARPALPLAGAAPGPGGLPMPGRMPTAPMAPPVAAPAPAPAPAPAAAPTPAAAPPQAAASAAPRPPAAASAAVPKPGANPFVIGGGR